jgi:hypothetical protein
MRRRREGDQYLVFPGFQGVHQGGADKSVIDSDRYGGRSSPAMASSLLALAASPGRAIRVSGREVAPLTSERLAMRFVGRR